MGRLLKEIKYKKIGKIWYYNVKDTGFKSSGTSTKSECQRIANKKLKELEEEKNSLAGEKISFFDYANKFFIRSSCPRTIRKSDQGKPSSERYLQIQRINLETHILKSRLKDKKLAEIKRADVLDFRGDLKKKDLSPSTVNKIMSALGVIFSEALFRQDISFDPTQSIGNLKDTGQPTDIFSQNELERLFSPDYETIWKDRLSYTCFLFALHTGMRRGEVLAVKWKHIDFDKKMITVEEAWKDVNTIGPPKNGKIRWVPMSSTLKSRLLEYWEKTHQKSTESLVFCYPDGSRLGETWWLKQFNSALKNAEIPTEGRKLRPHSLRHQMGTLLCSEGVRDDMIQASMGWSSKEIQKRYTHIGPEQLEGQGDIIEKALTKAL